MLAEPSPLAPEGTRISVPGTKSVGLASAASTGSGSTSGTAGGDPAAGVDLAGIGRPGRSPVERGRLVGGRKARRCEGPGKPGPPVPEPAASRWRSGSAASVLVAGCQQIPCLDPEERRKPSVPGPDLLDQGLHRLGGVGPPVRSVHLWSHGTRRGPVAWFLAGHVGPVRPSPSPESVRKPRCSDLLAGLSSGCR